MGRLVIVITLHGVAGPFAILLVSMKQLQNLDLGLQFHQWNQDARKRLILNHVQLINCQNAQKDANQLIRMDFLFIKVLNSSEFMLTYPLLANFRGMS